MPEAKRNKVVSLTQVKPKTREHKEFIVNKVQGYLARYSYLYLLTFDNMSTNNFKALRESLTDSKFLMGKNKVIGVALGVDEENSYKPNSYRVTQVVVTPLRISKDTALSSSPTKINSSARISLKTSRRRSSQQEERSPPRQSCSRRALTP